jgi:arabinogalactan oligomer / maltooligosaccharide transport system substrate-binding protein
MSCKFTVLLSERKGVLRLSGIAGLLHSRGVKPSGELHVTAIAPAAGRRPAAPGVPARRWTNGAGRFGKAACVAAVVAALACSDTADRPAELVVGTSWIGQGATALNQELLRVAESLGPVSVDLRTFSLNGLNDYLLRSQPAAAPGSLDVVVVPNDWLVQLFERDLITELPLARVEALQERLVRQALLAVSDSDRVLAYPVSAEVLALVYDPGRFPSPPETMEEILGASLPPGVQPFALNVLSPAHLTPLVSSFQGALLDREGTFVWHDADLLTVLQRLEPLWRTAGAWEVCRSDDPESLQLQLFNEGKLASFVGGPWLLEALEATGRPFAVMPIPPFADSPHPAQALVGYQCIAVLRETAWVDIALELGARLTEEVTNEAVNRGTRRLPVLLSSYQSRRAMTSAGTVGFLRALESGQAFPPATSWSEGLQRVENRLQRLRALARPPTREELARAVLGGRS